MTDPLRDAINAFNEVIRSQAREDQFIRDVVRDNAREMHPMSGIAETNINKVTPVGAATLGDWISRGDDRGITRDQRRAELERQRHLAGLR